MKLIPINQKTNPDTIFPVNPDFPCSHDVSPVGKHPLY